MTEPLMMMFSEIEMYVTTRRLRGDRLDDIAEKASARFNRGITRERVRQICHLIAKRMEAELS